MFKKDESDNSDITGAAKKIIIGLIFVVAVPAMITSIAGVDIMQICSVDPETGECAESTNKFFVGDAKAIVVMVVDLFFLILGLAIAIGPGVSVIKYRLVIIKNPGNRTNEIPIK